MRYLNYSGLGFNEDIVFDLPLREGTGAVTRDAAPPHHDPVTLVNTPTWESLASGLGVLTLDGASEYLLCLAADCLDLDFTDDYSIAMWVKMETGDDSQIVIARYSLNTGGWELYWYEPTRLLTIRHHHAGEAVARSAAYSAGWTGDVWHFLTVTFEAGAPGTARMYRNGIQLPVTTGAGGILNPEAIPAANFQVGVRSTLDSNYLKGSFWRPRLMARALRPGQVWTMWNREKGWFE